MRKCIWLAMIGGCWSLMALTASAQGTDPKINPDPKSTVKDPQLKGSGAGGQGQGGQPLPGFVQNPGQFPQGFVPGGQGMGAQTLPPGMQPTVPVGQIMGLRALQMMGASRRGPQYGAGGNMNNTLNGYNNPGIAVPTTPQVDPEQLKKDERRSKVRERAELKRAKEKEQAELRKLKAQEAKNNAPAKEAAPQAKADEGKK